MANSDDLNELFIALPSSTEEKIKNFINFHSKVKKEMII